MSYEYLEGPVDLPGAQESSGKILKHRWLAQQLLGRPLKNNEIVLKKDFNKEYSKDNIIVFSQRYCSRRWYSEDKEKYLFEEEPHVYNYDWDKITEAAFHDKKADGDTVTVTMVNEPGSYELKTMKCLDVIELAKACLGG